MQTHGRKTKVAKMKALEVIAAALPQLSDKDREALLKVLEADQSPCARLGHNFKAVRLEAADWWKAAELRMVCTRCGEIRAVS
jgi:hypothetical protein